MVSGSHPGPLVLLDLRLCLVPPVPDALGVVLPGEATPAFKVVAGAVWERTFDFPTMKKAGRYNLTSNQQQK